MKVFTIGFTQRGASDFFESIRKADIQRVIDVRLNNQSQLAGFSKKSDLKYFLSELCHADYIHVPEFAPTKELLDAYKKDRGHWDAYAEAFTALLEQRRVESKVSRELFDHGCLLCSERKPHHCHRRLVVEYLNDKWGGCLDVSHL